MPHTTNFMIKDIKDIILSEAPDLTYLSERLGNSLNISMEDASLLANRVVADINTAIFPPINKIELILTENCNLACTYCFEKGMHAQQNMPFDIAKAAIDLLFDYSKSEPQLFITFFGGEPTLSFSTIQFVTEYAEQKALLNNQRVDFNMTSNGTLMSDSMVDYFARHRIKVLLSIDGLELSHDSYRTDRHGGGSFGRVIKGLKTLKKVQPWIGTKVTVMPENVHRLLDDVIGLYGLGVNQFIISHATGIVWSDEHLKSYRGQLLRLYCWYKELSYSDLRISVFENDITPNSFGCRAGSTSIAVSINGDISPCSKMLALDKKHLVAKLGDVKYGLTHLRNRIDLVSCEQLKEACENLDISEEYQGGCFAVNYAENNNIFQPSLQEHAFSRIYRSIY